MKKILIFFLFFNTAFSSFSNPPGYKIKKIVIDAGHGGKDPGCHGASTNEKDVCLSVALNLGKLISENLPEVEVIYTRSTDMFPTLYERAKIANDNKADLFICIHANSAKSPKVFGTETYVMGLHVSEANLEVAKRENSAILMEENYKNQYEGFDPNSDESYIALSLLQNTYLEQSLNFASKIQKHIGEIKRYDRGVKQAGFLVLYKTAMPSVLIETGFLTNKEEEIFLSDSANQYKMSYLIFEAFKEYKNELEKNSLNSSNGKKNEKELSVKNENLIDSTAVKEPQKKTMTENEEVVYKVQISSSAQKIPLTSGKFSNIDLITEYFDGVSYKYLAGKEKTLECAGSLQKVLKDKGFKGAFIVAFCGEKKISLEEASKISRSSNNEQLKN